MYGGGMGGAYGGMMGGGMYGGGMMGGGVYGGGMMGGGMYGGGMMGGGAPSAVAPAYNAPAAVRFSVRSLRGRLGNRSDGNLDSTEQAAVAWHPYLKYTVPMFHLNHSDAKETSQDQVRDSSALGYQCSSNHDHWI